MITQPIVTLRQDHPQALTRALAILEDQDRRLAALGDLLRADREKHRTLRDGIRELGRQLTRF